MQPARFYEQLAGDQVICRLCAHACRLKPGQTGPCRVRHNVAGRLLTAGYGRPVMLAVEPVEKKYLFHVLPGHTTLSLGTPGCNMACSYCINWRVSQRGVLETEEEVSPAAVVDKALAAGAACIAFTYTEPTIFIEYALDIARLAHRAGLAVVAKSNGLISPAALQSLAPWLAALNIDLKAWSPEKHYRVTGSRLEPVLDSLRLAGKVGLWLEVSTLVVPGLNEQAEDLAGIAHFIATELGPDTPWHILRFFPNHRLLDRPPTPQAVLQQAVEQGRQAGLRYIYNKELAHGRQFQTTCPYCRAVLLRRDGFRLVQNRLQAGCCPQCGRSIAGVGLDKQPALSTAPALLEAS